MPTRRLARAALFTFGATLALAGCSGDGEKTSTTSTGGSGGADAGADAGADVNIGPMYGCAPPCGLGGASGAAGEAGASGASGAAGGDASTAGAYGLPPDAG